MRPCPIALVSLGGPSSPLSVLAGQSRHDRGHDMVPKWLDRRLPMLSIGLDSLVPPLTGRLRQPANQPLPSACTGTNPPPNQPTAVVQYSTAACSRHSLQCTISNISVLTAALQSIEQYGPVQSSTVLHNSVKPCIRASSRVDHAPLTRWMLCECHSLRQR